MGRHEMRKPRRDLPPVESIDGLLRRMLETIERSRASLAADPPVPGAIAAISGFAATEDRIADVHEHMASLRPARADEYRHVAQAARAAAQRAREIVRTFETDGR